MKESFNELYTKLYKENFENLELLRKKNKTKYLIIIGVVILMFILMTVNPMFILIGIVIITICVFKDLITGKNKSTSKNDYVTYFKSNIIQPLIENTIDGAMYNQYDGISHIDYRRAKYYDNEDRYRSEDKIVAPIIIDGENKTTVEFCEVLTERESTDEDGNTTYTTLFSGLAGQAKLNKSINSSVFIKRNGFMRKFSSSKVNMDMSEFEKIFDVEANDKILAMRILTADIMQDMIELYRKYGYIYEVHLIDDRLYMRISTGPLFEPNIFKSSMEYKTIEKYYLVLKAFMKIVEKMYTTIDKLDV